MNASVVSGHPILNSLLCKTLAGRGKVVAPPNTNVWSCCAKAPGSHYTFVLQ